MNKNNVNVYTYILVLLLLLASVTMTHDAKAQCGQTTITQSTSQDINGGFTCGAIPVAYFRAFELSTFGINDDFNVCAVEVGVFGGSNPIPQPLTVNLYTSNPAFPDGALTQIGTTDYELNDGFGIVSIPVSGNAPAGSELVVEIFSPNGNDFIIGINGSPETGESYIQSTPCGFPQITPTEDAGGPFAHYVMNVVGTESPARSVPTLSEWGLIAMAGILALAGLIVIKRRKVTA